MDQPEESASVSTHFLFLFGEEKADWARLCPDVVRLVFHYLTRRCDFLALRHTCRAYRAASEKLGRVSAMRSYTAKMEAERQERPGLLQKMADRIRAGRERLWVLRNYGTGP